MRACYTKQNINSACPNFNAFVFSEITQKLFHICLSLWKNNHWHSIIQLPVVWNHYWLSVQSSYSNIKTTSGCYFDEWMILKFDLEVACLWNANSACELRAVSVVTCELWAAIQSVCWLWAASSAWELGVVSVCIISNLHYKGWFSLSVLRFALRRSEALRQF